MEKKGHDNLMSRMEINDNKAGMDGLDKEKINQIIYQASKGSKFYENERKKEEQLNQKISRLKDYASQIGPKKLQNGTVQADGLLDKLKQERDVNHSIIHVDMDAFYAAVEMRDDPTLRSKPMAVGGMGMLSTSNYLARKFGVRAAMPGFIGLKLCPDLEIVKPNFEKYIAVSHDVREILSLYDSNFCPMSLDEAYLNFDRHLEERHMSLVSERTFILRHASDIQPEDTQCCKCDLNAVLRPSILNSEEFLSSTCDEVRFKDLADNFKLESGTDSTFSICKVCGKLFPGYTVKVYGLDVEEAVLEMRNRIEQKTHLTASAGIAPNMMLAKICSDRNKPNGQYRILPEILHIERFIEDLPIRKVSGIGKVTEKLLGGLDVVKCSDIYRQRALLYHLFSPASFHHFLQISLGMGSTIVERDDERKSISTEQTFSELSDVDVLCRKCDEMSEAVAEDLKKENLKGKTITLKIKTVSFEIKTRSQTLPSFTHDENVIAESAKKLLLAEIHNLRPSLLRLRLMGVRVSKLVALNNMPTSVNSYFTKRSEKEGTSTTPQMNHGNCSHLGTKSDHCLDPCGNVKEEDDEEEDFSRPLNTQIVDFYRQNGEEKNCSTNTKKETITKKECAASDIMKYFSKQKDAVGSNKLKVKPEFLNVDTESINPHSTQYSTFIENPLEKSSLPDNLEINCDTAHGCFLPAPCVPGPSTSMLTCPICCLAKSEWNLQSLNVHIDSCLSRQAIKDILQKDKAIPSNSAPSKRGRTDDADMNQQKSGKARKKQSSVLSYFQK